MSAEEKKAKNIQDGKDELEPFKRNENVPVNNIEQDKEANFVPEAPQESDRSDDFGF
jgi:hypothetical protein